MIKLVLSDLDSTLLWKGERHIATPHALEAIHALQDAGVCFAPATGRLYPELEGMFAGDRDAFRSAVVSNGQLVYLDGELAQSTPTPREGLEELRMLLAREEHRRQRPGDSLLQGECTCSGNVGAGA